jgi:molecular chaperone GrpE
MMKKYFLKSKKLCKELHTFSSYRNLKIKENENKQKEIKFTEALNKIQTLEQSLLKQTKMKRIVLTSDNEMEIIRKTAREEVDSIKKEETKKFALSLLEVADNLSSSIQPIQSDKLSSDDKVLKSLYQGIMMTERILLKVFSHHQIRPIDDPTNQVYDPKYHEVVKKTKDHSFKNNTVIQVVKRGYLINDVVLRPTQVIIVKNKS